VTYRINVNIPADAASGIVITDIVPAGLKFLDAAPIPNPPGPGSLSVVSLPTPGSTPGTGTKLVWTLPGPVPPGNYSLTYTALVPSFSPSGEVILNEAMLTYPQHPVPQTVQAPATVAGNYTIKINIYNEAGEIVKIILTEKFSQPLRNVSLETSNVLDSIHDKINIVYEGRVIGAWDGTNINGEYVSNGQYYIKIDNIDNYGVVDSVTLPAVVSRHLARLDVAIYNETGEMVRHLGELVADAMNPNSGIDLSRDTISPSYQGGDNSNVDITLSDGTTLVWDGRNDKGQIVSNGQYYVQVRGNDGQGGDSMVTKQITVFDRGVQIDPGKVVAYPNPVHVESDPLVVNFAIDSTSPLTLKVGLYTTAGELVQRVEGLPGANRVKWDFTELELAGGLYLAVVEVTDSKGGMQRQVLKVAVLK
jgi:flagellar hook assembly protein FlgD